MCAGAAPGQTGPRLVYPAASGPFSPASCAPYTKRIHSKTPLGKIRGLVVVKGQKHYNEQHQLEEEELTILKVSWSSSSSSFPSMGTGSEPAVMCTGP